jgi:predicted negative regulator of RcsB-dependent stress response
MALDLEEQEQLAALKAWWNQYGNIVTWILIGALLAFSAWTGWNAYLRSQATDASILYQELQKSFAEKNNTKVIQVASDLQAKYGRSAYAEMAAMTAAKSAFDANDLPVAKNQLQWVIQNGKNPEYVTLARVRLAGILLDEKNYDEALKTLAGEFPEHLSAIVSDRKGDIFMAQQKIEEARAAYETALDKMDAKNPGRQLVQVKLDALGGPAKPAA